MPTRRPPRVARPNRVARLGVCVGAVLGAACASNARSSPVLPNSTDNIPVLTNVSGPAGSADFRNSREPGFGVQLPLRADADRAFGVMQAAYEGLGLTFNTIVTDARIAGTRAATAPDRINNLRLSRFLQCGVDDGMGSSNADTYTVTLTAVSRVDVVGPTTSVVQTQVAATARGRTSSGAEVRCRSTGRLERLINEAVAKRAES